MNQVVWLLRCIWILKIISRNRVIRLLLLGWAQHEEVQKHTYGPVNVTVNAKQRQRGYESLTFRH